MNTNDGGEEFEDEGGGEGSGAGAETKFVEVDGKKFVDDGTGQPKKGANGENEPYIENQRQPETPEARKSRLDRQQEQHKKKHPELYETEGKKGKKGEKSDEFDLGQEAYLMANGVKEDDEVAAVKAAMESSGKSMKEVLKASWFQAELKEIRDQKEAFGATPQGKNRNGQSASNTVDYWIAKGTLPPNTPEYRELRTKVVNAKVAKQKNTKMFTDNPVG